MERFSHQTARLSPGRHESPEDGVCVMELASVLAGEPFSDRPRCVSPSLAAVLRGYNDGLDDDRRQTLKRFAAVAVGTAAARAVERRRRRRIGLFLAAECVDGGLRARMARSLIAADPYAAAAMISTRVRTNDDEPLHGAMLNLVDEVVGMSASPEAEDAVVTAPAVLRVPAGPAARDC
jgi:hypothetical protein